ncbi:hypothetical protein DH2020_048178 [Rehmannia glutinosa]|uniref:Uncharacterized protein n=1 Tax=Rehmannia glutinosa TaxID=99300 RepID=A0ABR0U7D3_REHGL
MVKDLNPTKMFWALSRRPSRNASTFFHTSSTISFLITPTTLAAVVGPIRPSIDHFDVGPSLDLQLSISVTPLHDHVQIDSRCVDALKWEAAEQIRLAAMEKACAERVMEMTRKEMEWRRDRNCSGPRPMGEGLRGGGEGRENERESHSNFEEFDVHGDHLFVMYAKI